MKKLFSLFILASSFCLVANKSEAVTNITSTSTTPITLSSGGESTVNISSGGNLVIDTDTSSSAAISSSNNDNINITINTTDITKGINTTGSSYGAISITGTAYLSAFTLTSGIVSSAASSSSLGTFFASSTARSLSIGSVTESDPAAKLENTANGGNAIYISSAVSSPSVAERSITINRTGTILASDHSSSTAIKVVNSSNNSNAILSISNAGTINSVETSATAISLSGYKSTVGNSGTIHGAITMANGSELDLTNAGTINGNITLGNHTGSSITLNTDSVINGNVILASSSQALNISGGYVVGTVSGSGSAQVMQDTTTSSAMNINFTSGYFQVNSGKTFSGSNTEITATTTIINASSSLSVNKLTSTNTVTLGSGSTLTVGTGGFIGGADGSSANIGSVNLAISDNSTTSLLSTFGGSSGIANFSITSDNSTITLSTIKSLNVALNGTSNIYKSQTIIGDISIASGNTLQLDPTSSSVTGKIDGSSAGVGNLKIANSAEIINNGNIGSDFALSEILIKQDASFDVNTNSNSVRATNIILETNSTFNIGSSLITGTIKGSSDGAGSVIFNQNNDLAGNVGISSYKINSISVANSKTVNTTSYDIYANNITLGSGSTLNIQDSIVSGDISGSSNGNGNIAISGTSEIGKIGNANAISSLTIASEATTRINEDSIRTSGDFTINGNAAFIQESSTITAANTIFASGSLLALTINDASATSLTIVGAANLSANTTLYLTISDSIAVGSNVTLIDASEDSSLNVISDSKIKINGTDSNIYNRKKYTTSVIANKLILNVANAEISSNIFANQNQKNINNYINNISSTNGELDSLKNYIISDSSSTAQKESALKSAEPQTDNSINRTNFDNAINAMNIISARLNSINNNNISSSNFSANSFTQNYLNKNFPLLSELKQNDINSLTPFSMSLGGKNNPHSVWIQTFGSKTKQGAISGIDGFNASSSGLAIGIDEKVNKNLTLGISTNYSQSQIKSNDNNKKTDLTSYQFNLYSGYNFKSYFLNTTLGLSLNDYDSSRYIPVANVNAKANYSGNNYFIRSEFGKNYKFENDVLLTPTFLITAASNQVEQYQENGAGTLNLNVKNDRTNFLETRFGAELSKMFLVKGKNLRPQISTSYGYDLIGDKQKTTSNFVGQTTSFETSGAKIAQGSFKASAGITLYDLKGATISTNYNYEHRNKYNSHSGWLVLRYGF